MSEFALTHIAKIISAAAKKSGRNHTDIKLVGVTKSMDTTTIAKLLDEGVQDLGENRVQDFLPKYEKMLPQNPTWHFIGHLQRNKVKFIIDKVAMIHSVDSIGLANEIDKQAKKIGKNIDILMEVNIANEASKYGVSPDDIISFANELTPLTNIRVRGLMCIAPYVENPEDNRPYFKNMRNLLVDINKCSHHNLTELSMGMSGDYAVAIQEGATMVRIGTALIA